MKKFNLFCIVILVLLTETVFSQNDSAVTRYELDTLNKMFGYRAVLNITATGEINSLPTGVINISLDELQKISSIKDKPTRLYLLRLVLAHEFAHQMQFYKYKDDKKFLSNDRVSRTVIEAQADLLAGFMMFKLSPEVLVYLQSQHKEMFKKIFDDVSHAMYNLGIRENTLGSHPSKNDRLMAIKLGMVAGLTHNMDEQLKMTNPANQPKGFINDYKEYSNKLFDYIDLLKDEDIVKWSYRQARKIVNADRKIANDIVLITPVSKTHSYNADPANPNYEYNLTYKNRGEKAIYIEMEVYVGEITDEYAGVAEKVNAKQHKFTIQPMMTYSVKGKLNTQKTDFGKLGEAIEKVSGPVKLIFPGGTNSDDMLFSCAYLNDASENVAGAGMDYFNLKEEPVSADKFSVFLRKLINKAISDPYKCITGVGRAMDKNVISYLSSVQYEEGSQTSLQIDTTDNFGTFVISFPNYYPSKNKMLSKYNELKAFIQKAVASPSVTENINGDNALISISNDEVTVLLSTIKFDFGKVPVYTIEITVLPDQD